MSKEKYTLKQFQAVAEICGIKVASVKRITKDYHFDVGKPAVFKKQHDALLRRKKTSPDDEVDAARKQRIVEQGKKEKVLREKAELELEIKKGNYISLEEEAALWAHVGLMIKTHIEAMGGSVSMMCEGKSAKEIKKVIDAKGAEILFQLSTIK